MGGNGNDWLFGGNNIYKIEILLGGSGDDYLDGGAGADDVNGEGGDDIARGGANRDIVHGGSGIGGGFQGMRPWADRLLAEGYVVLLPDYHLFSPGGASPVFPWPEQNIKAAVQYLLDRAK